MFESRDKSRLQELGPRFTLKPRWIQVYYSLYFYCQGWQIEYER